MKTSVRNHYLIFSGIAVFALAFFTTACRQTAVSTEQAHMLLQNAKYPHATFYGDRYYFTSQPTADTIYLTAVGQLEDLAHAEPQAVWSSDNEQPFQHLWSPELHRIQGAWYIYFEADDGNMDNHHLYVIRNANDNPLRGTWEMCGELHTNDEWNYGLHPTILNIESGLYLLWSGWPKRRTEIETQCIYIAQMDNPWTVGSERVMLSKPEYEWELQWINPNGNRLAYPIYVNENPEAFRTPDGRHVCVCYSASGIWTIYHVLGMLTAPASADLLDPASWTKSPEPLFTAYPTPSGSSQNTDGTHETDETEESSESLPTLCGTSNICLVTDAATSRLITSADGRETPLLYEGEWFDADGNEHRSVFLGSVRWSDDGLPDFGHPEL